MVLSASPTFTGTLTPQGSVDISGSGAGQIKFPSAQNASSDPNTLDDYEEGTFTPGLGGTATYSGTPAGIYTKIGRKVFYGLNVVVNAIGTGSTSQIFGLPFVNAAAGTGNMMGSVDVGYFASLATAVVYIGGQIPPNSSLIQMVATTAAAFLVATPALFQTSSYIELRGSYQTT